jgi:tetratricopeptide (TPR) repeat protein
MKSPKILLPLVAVVALAGCPKSGTTTGGSTAKPARTGKPGKNVAKATTTPVVQKSVTRESSSSNPQAVSSFKEAVDLLEKIRKEGTGSYDTAITRLEGAVSLDGEFAEAHYNLGVIYEDLGRYDKAESSFSRAVRANPKLTEASASLGRIYLLRGNTAKAKEFFNTQLTADPKNKDIRNKLAEILRLEKNYPAAHAQVKQVLFVDPDNIEAYKTLALIFMDEGKTDMAKMTCANALKIDSDNASIYNNLGLIYLKQGDTLLAAAQFSKALEKDAGFAPALANLGAIALDHKDYNLAAECFGKLSRIKPSNTVALNAYAVSLRGLGSDADSQAKFHEDKGNDDGAKEKRADAKKRYDESKEHFMRVYALDKDFHEVSYNLGVLNQRGYKDFKTAIRYYQDYIGKAGISDPNNPVYANIKQCEQEIKAAEMMNAPSPTPTAAPEKEGAVPAPGDVSDGKGADGAKTGEKPKADAGTPAANGGGKMTHQ